MPRFVSAALLLVLAAVVLTACGRKGDLDTPYQAAVDAREEAGRNDQPLPPEPVKPADDKPFILDALL